jgi:hypothetical protein
MASVGLLLMHGYVVGQISTSGKRYSMTQWNFDLQTKKKKNCITLYWSEFLATDPEAQVRSLALPGKKKSSGSGTGSTQPREYN